MARGGLLNHRSRALRIDPNHSSCARPRIKAAHLF
jgi:hypothetical protein